MSSYSPQQRRRPYDFVELAPSGQSTCRLCQKRITKGTMRVAIHYLNRGTYWNCYYHHKECMTSTQGGKELMKKANFKESCTPSSRKKRKGGAISPAERIEIEAATVTKKKRIAARTAQETLLARGNLRETLRRLRSCIASQLSRPLYMVFTNEMLDSLVLNLPCTTAELMRLRGFGPKNSKSLGPMILPFIGAYKESLSSGTSRNVAVPQKTSVDHKGDDDEVIFEAQESIDDVIRRKIKEAEDRGEVIEL